VLVRERKDSAGGAGAGTGSSEGDGVRVREVLRCGALTGECVERELPELKLGEGVQT